MTSPHDGPGPKRRGRRRIWPPEASLLIQQRKNSSALCAELAALTGNDERACWRFLNKHGIQRPGSKRRSSLDPRVVNNLVDYVSENGVQAAAMRFGCEPKTIYNLLYRQERTRLSRDCLSLREVCNQLRVKYRKGVEWIERGLLHATRSESTNGYLIYVIEFEVLQKFCKEHRNLLVTRRLSPSRLRFLEEYIFAPKHAELLKTRESKREGEAFERGEYLRDPRCSQKST
jgi:hypothetical protein